MRTRRQATIQDLRRAIDCLPRDSKVAMLQGLASNQIIAGAYSTADGICPMLAAHRAGGRTSLVSFARAWDAFAYRGARRRVARAASRRELLVLRAHLEASLLEDDAPESEEFASVIAEHREQAARCVSERPRPGDPNRAGEMSSRPGWAWLRAVRRYDDYERALAALREAPLASSPEETLELSR